MHKVQTAQYSHRRNGSDQNGDQDLRKYVQWKPLKLYKGKHKWWVEYQFRLPAELRYRYANARWKGFRVYDQA